ncbi:PepSY domain-containing protein [Paracoccus sp. R86501]|uniref:PepSY domain-containing protein n=1 Tax=Paracoccus sp. R86501 TaxID=3101711 RepID=UPI003672205A
MILTALPVATLPMPGGAQEMPPFASMPAPADFRPMPTRQVVRRVTARYAGRPIAIELVPPFPPERDMDVQLVYRVRLLTEGRDLLDIRLDARDGRFLEVAGHGQLQARRPAGQR